MKRALAILAACSLFGFAGLAQFTGTWDTNIHLLPSSKLGLDYTQLTLSYDLAGWTLGSTTKFTSSGYTVQDFSLSGTLGALAVSGSMSFDPSAPAYKSSSISIDLDFAGVAFGLSVDHWDDAYLPDNWSDYCDQTPSALMLYTLTASADPVSAELVFSDCCTGIAFNKATITLSSLSLCCGVTYDVEFAFNKTAGFDYVKFSAYDVFPICCGISFDLSVKFSVDAKTVTITPKMADIGEACFALYADLDKSSDGTSIYGLDIYGYKISCTFADCNTFEVLHAWDVSKVEDILDDTDIFQGDEFEYFKWSFCGPGCCGGEYSVGISVYFGTSGKLFDITRIAADLSIPLMSNFTLNVKFASDNNLDVGWTFSF